MFFDCAASLYKGGEGGGWKMGNIMPSSSFAYDGVHVFLTYPQCALERSKLRDFFLAIEPNANYIVARELHDDGSPHLHAYVHFGRRRRFADARAFDVEGYHPNIQKPRSAAHCITYCRKEDTEPLVSEGLDAVHGNVGGWAEVLEMSQTRDAFLGAARERFPRDYVLSLERLLFFCEWKFGRDETPYDGRRRDEFREPLSLTEWCANLVEVNMVDSCRGGPSPLPPRSNILSCLYWLSFLGVGASALARSCWRISSRED